MNARETELLRAAHARADELERENRKLKDNSAALKKLEAENAALRAALETAANNFNRVAMTCTRQSSWRFGEALATLGDARGQCAEAMRACWASLGKS